MCTNKILLKFKFPYNIACDSLLFLSSYQKIYPAKLNK